MFTKRKHRKTISKKKRNQHFFFFFFKRWRMCYWQGKESADSLGVCCWSSWFIHHKLGGKWSSNSQVFCILSLGGKNVYRGKRCCKLLIIMDSGLIFLIYKVIFKIFFSRRFYLSIERERKREQVWGGIEGDRGSRANSPQSSGDRDPNWIRESDT